MNAKLTPLMASHGQEWGTPTALFANLHRRHRFTLDAAASPQNAKLAKFFSRHDCGLRGAWAMERVWVNPPYGRDVTHWMAKAIAERCTAVVLVPARTDTVWWHRWVLPFAAEVAYVRGRLTFEGAPAPAPFPSALITYGPHRHPQRHISVDRTGEPL